MIEIKITAESAEQITKEIQGLAEKVVGVRFSDTNDGDPVAIAPEAKAPIIEGPMPTEEKTGSVEETVTATTGLPTTKPPTYKLEEIMAACGPLLDQGKQAELSALVQSFGAQSISFLSKEHYPALVVKLREMGAHI
ncbi:hypothetical protein [uncultured Megasphaera sp.]|uniref:hypothetical protein n=1 Tax=uncultured Megasphaera sp. TaxID=165188 RepID=UPI0025965F38|nr:hypothetical protein [uncultured Megasphaera sp.]